MKKTIIQAKKEVFDDLDILMESYQEDLDKADIEEYIEIKEKHKVV